MSDTVKVKNRTAGIASEGPCARLLSWPHNIHPGVVMKLDMILVVCIATLLIGASFILSSYLSRELQVNALEMIKTNTRIFHNSVSNEFQRVTRDAEHCSNVYINNYQNVANKPPRYMDSTELKAVPSSPNTNAHFTELTNVFANTFILQGEQFVRISSTLLASSGNTATATALGHDNSALLLLSKNKPFSGVVTLLGKQFVSHYEPIADKYGQVVGTVAVGFDVKQSLQPIIQRLLNVHIGKDGYVYVLGAEFEPGHMLVHPSLGNQQAINITDANSFKLLADMLEHKNGITYYNWISGCGALPKAKIAVYKYAEGINWIIATTNYADDVTKSSNLVRNGLLLLTVLPLPIILLLIAVTSRSLISRRLNRVLGIAQTIAEGDLMVGVQVDRYDEIGKLLSTAGMMRQRLHSLVGGIVSHASSVHQASLYIIEVVDGQAPVGVETSSSVVEITSTMEKLSASSTQIVEHSQAVVDITNQTPEDCNKGSESMSQLLMRMTDIDTDNQQNMREIMMFGNKSTEVSCVMAIINSVADQTKLIAFNAALEATSAGEAGKRFSVVAAEVRRLADSMTESTVEIENKISEIQNAINRLVLNVEKGGESIKAGAIAYKVSAEHLNDIVVTVEQTSATALQISLSTQQQETTSNQVVMTLREIVVASNYTPQSIKDTLVVSQDMTQLSKALKEASPSFTLTETDA